MRGGARSRGRCYSGRVGARPPPRAHPMPAASGPSCVSPPRAGALASCCPGDSRVRPRGWRNSRARRRARRAAAARGPCRPRLVEAWPPGWPAALTPARRASPPRLARTAVADRGVLPGDGASVYTHVARRGAGCPHGPCWPPRGEVAPTAAAAASRAARGRGQRTAGRSGRDARPAAAAAATARVRLAPTARDPGQSFLHLGASGSTRRQQTQTGRQATGGAASRQQVPAPPPHAPPPGPSFYCRARRLHGEWGGEAGGEGRPVGVRRTNKPAASSARGAPPVTAAATVTATAAAAAVAAQRGGCGGGGRRGFPNRSVLFLPLLGRPVRCTTGQAVVARVPPGAPHEPRAGPSSTLYGQVALQPPRRWRGVQPSQPHRPPWIWLPAAGGRERGCRSDAEDTRRSAC